VQFGFGPAEPGKESEAMSSATSGQTEPHWVKARASLASNACVELARVDEMIAVRDSKNPEDAPHYYTKAEINAFFDGVRNGEFNFLLVE
jgi:hypothetical protein